MHFRSTNGVLLSWRRTLLPEHVLRQTALWVCFIDQLEKRERACASLQLYSKNANFANLPQARKTLPLHAHIYSGIHTTWRENRFKNQASVTRSALPITEAKFSAQNAQRTITPTVKICLMAYGHWPLVSSNLQSWCHCNAAVCSCLTANTLFFAALPKYASQV